jgi:hypothetical protein
VNSTQPLPAANLFDTLVIFSAGLLQDHVGGFDLSFFPVKRGDVLFLAAISKSIKLDHGRKARVAMDSLKYR